ncbi:hypothetical protein IT408_00650 [Candidatus Uhrbacteria bacterium]|nr:hypothetical protein [Candidatus Uhrbacteria bacterium]
MQIFGVGNKIIFNGKALYFEDEQGNPVSLHDRRAIRFPDIKIASEILEEIRSWLEKAYRQHDVKAALELHKKSQGIYFILWKYGSFKLPSCLDPLMLTEISPEMLNHQGSRCITWLLSAITMKEFSYSISGKTHTWSMSNPAMSHSQKGSRMLSNSLRKGDTR